MKNIHVLPTDKPSRLFYNKKDSIFTIDNDFEYVIKEDWFQDYNIYIPSDEEIEEGDWFYDLGTTYIKIKQSWENSHLDFNGKKIILTTDPDLIKDGVQAIDDEFLEWFVENPSCEEVEVQKWSSLAECGYSYHIIIPKEEPTMITDWLDKHGDPEIYKKVEREAILKYGEPKQETLEEAAERMSKEHYVDQSDYWAVGVDSFKRGAKWQAERMYSEEEVLVILDKFLTAMIKGEKTGLLEKWFEQFKKK